MAAPANNAFGAPPVQAAHNSFRAPVVNNPFGAPSAQTSVLAPSSASSRQPSPASTQHPPAGPSAKAQLKSQLDAAKKGPRSGRSPSPSTSKAPPTGPSSQQLSVGATKANTMTRRNNKLTGGKPQAASNAGRFGGREGQTPESQRANPFGSAKPSAGQEKVAPTAPNTRLPPGGRRKQPGRLERPQPPRSSSRQGRPKAPLIGEPSERTKQLSPFAFDYANKLYDHLRKENIAPPEWPAEPGNPNNRAAVESFNADFKKYRDKVTASLRKADLIDDPEKRRKLKDALPFKGICEEMCPEFEQIKRIIEDTVSTEEKAVGPDGLTLWPDRSRMVKRYGRSSAGSDAPLPMDVRSVDALRRTTDYLFNDLLQSESNLPSMHSFLWDRTRAVRKDFTFHSQKSAEEMKDMVYCFEAIARFHATALHLLSKKGFANESFVQKQEFEQLGNTVLSLMEAYDACRDKHVQCENEAEFRAYYLLVNAEDPSIANRIPAWGKEFWFESEEVQTAVALVQAMEDVRKPKGPIKPHRPTSLADTSFTNYFSIVEDPRVSYTMACIAEVHFTQVRQAILKNLVRAYARSRDAPRTITASDLNAILRFDTPEEAVEFAELHGLEFSTWVPEGKPPVTEPYLLLNDKRKYVPPPQVGQSFSGTLVERKRSTQSLPYVIYNTIFEEPAEKSPSSAEDSPGLFVTRTAAAPDNSPLGTPSPPLQPAEPSTATAPSTSPFGTVFQTTQAPKTTPSAAAPTGTTTPTFAGFQTSQPSASTQAGKTPKRDPFGDFTKWFVNADDGLLEHFTEETLRNLLWDVWQGFQREEAERKRREEDEKSWRLAREHQNYRLRVKYFYRWRNNARSSATKRILREGKEKMRLYREQQQAIQRRQQAEKEKAEKEARRAAERQAVEDSRRISLLATSVRRRGSVAYSADHDPEEQLLASGIFSGLRDDPRSLARRVVREAAAADGGDAWSMASASRSFRYPESELELEPAPSARDSPDTSSVGGRREGWKTRSLREKFGIEPRRSLSASGSVVNGASFLSSSSRFRQSLPGSSSNKTTNFSRKRSAEEDGDDQDGEARRRSLYSSNAAPKTNGFARSRHWDLRARGFVPTPDGNWLPEAIVKAGKQRDSALEPESPRSEPRGYDHDPELLPDRDPSPTPSDLRLRLARLKQSRPHGLGHGTRHSVDLPPAASGFATDRWLLSPASPPHPPFASRHPANAANGAATAHAASRSPAADISPPPPPPPAASHPTPGIRPVSLHGKRKRTTEDADFATADRGIDGVAGDHQQSPSPSPSSSAARKKKANLDLDLNFNLDLHRLRRRDGGDADVDLHPPAAVPGREETCAMVENTRRMLRELREFMDRADREEGRAAAPGAGVPAAAPAAAGAAVGGESEVGVYSGR
ncbi:5a32b9cc-295e-4983-97b1-97e92369a6cd [Thermothielavioides terrestris]|uniref:5a32b9cc-295e-4983-97b1-97e92369a6cd n=1 Tax=Thermothielavioides terrestris TaxID=2587410 RepID=A0A3S4ASI9_9PEZI|nr:5a32b9cc-295e-4983-97b1-97e92369a6cd [Thermothielavioides terrestris]